MTRTALLEEPPPGYDEWLAEWDVVPEMPDWVRDWPVRVEEPPPTCGGDCACGGVPAPVVPAAVAEEPVRWAVPGGCSGKRTIRLRNGRLINEHGYLEDIE